MYLNFYVLYKLTENLHLVNISKTNILYNRVQACEEGRVGNSW